MKTIKTRSAFTNFMDGWSARSGNKQTITRTFFFTTNTNAHSLTLSIFVSVQLDHQQYSVWTAPLWGPTLAERTSKLQAVSDSHTHKTTNIAPLLCHLQNKSLIQSIYLISNANKSAAASARQCSRKFKCAGLYDRTDRVCGQTPVTLRSYYMELRLQPTKLDTNTKITNLQDRNVTTKKGHFYPNNQQHIAAPASFTPDTALIEQQFLM